jgi:hypothetical protein
VGDVDILARTRPVVDELGEVIAGVGKARCGPEWEQESPSFGQYYAEYEVSAVSVQLSTVEMDPTRSHPPGECSEHWPWEHFDVISSKVTASLSWHRSCGCRPRWCAAGPSATGRSADTSPATATTTGSCRLSPSHCRSPCAMRCGPRCVERVITWGVEHAPP